MIVRKKDIASNVERRARYHRPEQRNENNAIPRTLTEITVGSSWRSGAPGPAGRSGLVVVNRFCGTIPGAPSEYRLRFRLSLLAPCVSIRSEPPEQNVLLDEGDRSTQQDVTERGGPAIDFRGAFRSGDE